ncbi:MAG: hypothetical protein IJV05_04855 [Muribaculaceae bacterium]|nr:hypothetical protein [Muribaculaceae bacterium]
MAVVNANASTWKIHNYYVASKIQNVVDMGDKVYYLNSNYLFQFDKTTKETVSLGKQNILSENSVSQIYYDWENKLLFVAYPNANLDVIDVNGKVKNISNLKDIVVPVRSYELTSGDISSYVDKSINDITFAEGTAYVAYGIGYLTIDESTISVSKNYPLLGQKSLKINSVVKKGDEILIFSNAYCYHGAPGDEDPMHNYATISGSFTDVRTFPINDNSIFILGTKLYNYDFSSGNPSLTSLVSAAPTSVQKTATGFVANFAGQSYYYTIDATGKTATKVGSTACFASSDPTGDGSTWINDANGLHKNGTSTNYKMNSMTTDMPHWLKYNAAMNKLYVATPAPNLVDALTIMTNVINTYDGNQWANATAYSTGHCVGYEFVFDPMDPTTYVRTSWLKGIYKVTNDVMKTNYTSANSLIGNYKAHPAFDNYGNMWVVSSFGNAACPTAVLPRAGYLKATPSKTDWFQPSGLGNLNTGNMQRSSFVIAKKNNMKIYTDGDYPVAGDAMKGRLLCWDNGNEDPTVDQYRFTSISHFADQDNKQIDFMYINRMKEDKDGMIWVGHSTGLFMFDPTIVFDDYPRAIRPFAAKFSEGKGYLCEGYIVYDFGIDHDNNKWVATNNGLYFVSPDGTEVYNHFTTDNSDIPSNTIYSVECDTVNNRVYIYSDNGFAEYVANGDAAALNFDGTYAFPNPVEPDFTGMIKIAGLMDKTYVTITDRDGNVITQMGPVMGSALWDGSGADGERVPTGVYNIYVAQGAQPAVTGQPQATVMIIK